MRASFLPIFCIIVMQISGCATPAQRVDAHASGLGFRTAVLQGNGFDHAAYIKVGHEVNGNVLHVYLEGDGTPWLRKGVPAADPTPRNPLMLDLMVLDPLPSMYLGRPCYHGVRNKTCTPEVWTGGRYSEAVVNSMSVALDRAASGYSSLVLLGYSGGGTLAMLLAERQPKVTAVVTVAANLDVERWSALHKQQSLLDSLNPATRAPLPVGVSQMHFAGAEDDNVPPSLVRDAITKQPRAMFKVYPKQDHGCCWHEVWPEILAELEGR